MGCCGSSQSRCRQVFLITPGPRPTVLFHNKVWSLRSKHPMKVLHAWTTGELMRYFLKNFVLSRQLCSLNPLATLSVRLQNLPYTQTNEPVLHRLKTALLNDNPKVGWQIYVLHYLHNLEPSSQQQHLTSITNNASMQERNPRMLEC